jgi:hypothetical protein
MPSLPPGRSTGRTVIVAALVLGLSGCNAATQSASSSPQPTSVPSAIPSGSAVPTPAPTVGAIDHPTGATDVVLRLDTSGGFVPVEFLASSAPTFTLYGNGIVVFQPKVTTPTAPDPSGLMRNLPWRAARLDENQIQELLAFALGPGGLGAARDAYLAGGVADVPNTIFQINAGGLEKTVVVNALDGDSSQGPDSAARSSLLRLAERLRDFDQGGSISTDVYQPEAFRGVLTPRDPDPSIKAVAWPWSTIKPADFKEDVSDGNGGIVLPHRTLTTAEVAQLGLIDVAGGFANLVLAGTDGKTYALTVRPLLPGETE